MEYLPIIGDQNFLDLSKKLYIGEKHDKTCNDTEFDNVQTLSGTGALELAGKLIAKTFLSRHDIYVPNPTWENHLNIFQSCRLNVHSYNYLTNNHKLNIDYLAHNIESIPVNSVILLHACAHNPTGYDLNYEEWREIIRICMSRNLFIIVDCAYLGFASGDLHKDRTLLKILDTIDYPSMICTSYAKNFGIYSKRAGNLFFKGDNKQITLNMKDTLKQIIRTSYSSPPSDGSNIVKTILEDNQLKKIWTDELSDINMHYSNIRKLLKQQLETKLNRNFDSITNQVGMFYYSKAELSSQEIQHMRDNHIYFLDNGRISLAGLTDDNILKFVDTLSKFKN